MKLIARIFDCIIALPFIITAVIIYYINHYWGAIINPVITLLVTLYFVVFLALFGATYGKHWKFLSVVKSNGDSISWYESIIRNGPDYFYAILSIFGTYYAISKVNTGNLQEISYFKLSSYLQASYPSVIKLFMGLITL